MKQFFITVLGVIVGGFLFMFLLVFLLAGLGAALGGQTDTASAEGATVLTLDMRAPLLDHSAGESLFGSAPGSVVDAVRALDRAKTDDNIKGLLIRTGFGMAPASAEELRLAMLDFKDSGKFIVAHSQGFEATSVIPYMAVTAADEIWQQSTSGFAPAGLYSESGFYGGVFDKYDAKAEFAQFYEYKNAANTYTQSTMTDAHREATTSYLNSIYEISVAHIAQDRNMTVDAVKAVLNTAPHSAEAALDAGMIDKLGYYVEVVDYVKTKAGGEKTKFKSIKSYGPKNNFTGPVVAFVGGQGPVTLGGSQDGSNPFAATVSMGSDTLSRAIKKAAEDDKVKAIVFRVSSPGGSATASDDIYNAVEIAKDAGKPVVISMGQYAASGGYYVAANADTIVAMPTTITGSIGVLGGKVALRDTYSKIGYNVEHVRVGGEYGGAYSSDEPFTQAQRKAFTDQMEDIYVDFTELVAAGRDMPIAQVQEIAKGRVWTGAQAKERGLVDEMGGIMKSIEVAKELAGIEADTAVNLRRYPRPKTRSEQFEQLLNASVEMGQDIGTLREITAIPEVQAILKARAEAEALANGQAQLKAPLPEIQ
ncbi:signal peptide peptidase SppA [Fretibacter rubidus]|uniref:signal peptide peptidase SppA n=1 Tax=Fretibacter rubidus TaxID=570162 RepID=UPI00352B5A28